MDPRLCLLNYFPKLIPKRHFLLSVTILGFDTASISCDVVGDSTAATFSATTIGFTLSLAGGVFFGSCPFFGFVAFLEACSGTNGLGAGCVG